MNQGCHVLADQDDPDPSFLKGHFDILGKVLGSGLMHSDEKININFISVPPLATIPTFQRKKGFVFIKQVLKKYIPMEELFGLTAKCTSSSRGR